MQAMVEIKQQIIDVADTRFRRYGFGKTTMAEIAKDCNMSAANLYRYFDNKQKIGVEIAEKCMRHKEKVGKDVLQREKLTASARLEVFFLEILHYTHDLCATNSHLFELVAFISQEHPDVVLRHQESLRSSVAEILAEGNRTGEFDVPDIIATAKIILFATVHFYYPPLVAMKNPSLEELKRAGKGVIALIIRGLAKH
ncbi:MAG: TetR/AcrR family transcriptional regulator [Nitrospira sp.]|nr:TetR/AcrR family transcriptional regulator [Candidatus Manganitrophaceae bacterium]HIL35723.1 TetR/AcrR family transcriptional regulator [Candidatus Manganitrophaceae bacterium]